MKNEKDIRYQLLYRLLYVLLLICVCIFGAGKLFGIYEVSIWQILIAFALTGFFCGFSFTNIRGRILCVVALVGCLAVVFLLVDNSRMAAFWSSYTDWLFYGTGWDEDWLVWYGCVQSVYLALGCYLFWCLAEHFPVMKKVSACVMGLALIICLVRREPISHIGVVCIGWYLLLIYIETTQEKGKKVQRHDNKSYMLWLMPFCVTYFLLSCIMPAPEKPFDWTFVKEAYQQIRETAIVCYRNLTRGEKEDFGLAVSGFSEDGTLGAGFIEDNRVLLEINGKGGLVTNIYLSGKIYDTFDGRGWIQTAAGDTQDRFLDTMETLYAVERYNGEATRDYVYGTKLRVCYQYLDTGYVFSPLKTWEVKGYDCISDGPNLVFGKQQGYGTEYTTTYYQMNVDHPVFYEMLEAHTEPDETLWNTLVRRHTPMDASDYATLEDLENHRAYIYENYANMPALSKEVEAYLDEITAEADTDIEKLRAIEAELSSYTYTKRPGKLPERVVDENSYLDYFLLESRQGYCSYFATAFVLLARAEGIPARYVEGFCVPVNEEKYMTVYSNMAHAWPEVYIDGVGWIPFEPTPGYEEIRYTPWEVKGQSEAQSSEPLMADEEDTPVVQEAEIEIEEEAAVDTFGQRHVILWGICGTLLAFLLIFLLDNIMKHYRYAHMQADEQFFVEIRKNLWVLSRLGLTRKDAETIQEFKSRAQEKLMEETDCTFAFLTVYEEVLYGGKEITPAMLQEVSGERVTCMQWVKSHRRADYYFMRLRLSYFGRWW